MPFSTLKKLKNFICHPILMKPKTKGQITGKTSDHPKKCPSLAFKSPRLKLKNGIYLLQNISFEHGRFYQGKFYVS